MSKTIYLLVGASVEVTEEEYEQLRQSAYDPQAYDCPYSDIMTPPWLTERLQTSGKIDGDGFISGKFWMERK